MQKTIQNIASVSFPFLLVLGLAHLTCTLLVVQGAVDSLDWLLFQTLDLPFLFVALLFGSSKLALLIEENTGQLKIPIFLCSGAAGMVFLLALFFNFGLSDVLLG